MAENSNFSPADGNDEAMTTLLLNAYLDDELDAAETVRFEARLAADQTLQARLAQLEGLRAAISPLAQQEDGLSPALRAEIARRFQPAPARLRRPVVQQWMRMAASVLFGAFLSAAVLTSYFDLWNGGRTDVVADAVAGHMRGLVASQPYDVASSDRHVVRPWLAAKASRVPRSPDLSAKGCVLAGARLDIIEQQPVPVLVYRLREHVISLTMLPSGTAPVTQATYNGFSILSWRENDITLLAVSDVTEGELNRFRDAYEMTREQGE